MNRLRKVGPYTNVTGVDVTGLTCTVNIYYVAEPRTIVVIEGPLLSASRVSVRTTSHGRTTQLTLADTARGARVGRRGGASTDVDLDGRHVQMHVVQRDKPFRRPARDSSVTVSFFVAAGTKVVY